jgi:murein DD-endopeptidase MepM/ murein hydrolase activator NlpD
MLARACLALSVVLTALAFAAPAAGMGRPAIAALQVTLKARGLYGGTVDGVNGPRTRGAVRRFQRRHGLVADGIAGPRTRRALGRFARFRLGSRPLFEGRRGWDVAALQFSLAWHGFPSGSIDGDFGPRTELALLRYQRFARLLADGVAGRATLRRLRSPPPRSPIGLYRPLWGPIGDRFGPRGNRFHTGIDFPASYGRGVSAAGYGRVTFAGWDSGGYGRLVIVRHRRGVRTWYAHLGRIDVRHGQGVSAGFQVGRVGSSGISTGPHLHFEVRVRGAAVDPLTALR